MFDFRLKKLHTVNYFIIALIAVSALVLSRSVISIVFSEKESVSTKTADQTASATAPAARDIMIYAPILEKNPFGSSMELIPLGKGPRGAEKVSLTDLILTGTAVGEKYSSYAIFLDSANPDLHGQQVFKYGEEVFNYGTLTTIEDGQVELTQDTDTYTVSISMEEFELEASPVPSKKSFAKKIGRQQYLLDQRRVREALENPDQILTDARLLPNRIGNKQHGFKVSEVKPGGLYESIGIRNNDILLRINNLEMSSPEAAMQAMLALKGMNHMNLDIIRLGSRMTIKYQMR